MTLKGRLGAEASSVGLPTVLNFAMRDFTSALPSYKHGEQKPAENRKAPAQLQILPCPGFLARGAADWAARCCNPRLPLRQASCGASGGGGLGSMHLLGWSETDVLIFACHNQLFPFPVAVSLSQPVELTLVISLFHFTGHTYGSF